MVDARVGTGWDEEAVVSFVVSLSGQTLPVVIFECGILEGEYSISLTTSQF